MAGRTVTLAAQPPVDVTIKAVIADFPNQSHLNMRSIFARGYDVFVSWDVLEAFERPTAMGWGGHAVTTYVLLPADGSLSARGARPASRADRGGKSAPGLWIPRDRARSATGLDHCRHGSAEAVPRALGHRRLDRRSCGASCRSGRDSRARVSELREPFDSAGERQDRRRRYAQGARGHDAANHSTGSAAVERRRPGCVAVCTGSDRSARPVTRSLLVAVTRASLERTAVLRVPRHHSCRGRARCGAISRVRAFASCAAPRLCASVSRATRWPGCEAVSLACSSRLRALSWSPRSFSCCRETSFTTRLWAASPINTLHLSRGRVDSDALAVELSRGPGIEGATSRRNPFQNQQRRFTRTRDASSSPVTLDFIFTGYDYFAVMDVPGCGARLRAGSCRRRSAGATVKVDPEAWCSTAPLLGHLAGRTRRAHLARSCTRRAVRRTRSWASSSARRRRCAPTARAERRTCSRQRRWTIGSSASRPIGSTRRWPTSMRR